MRAEGLQCRRSALLAAPPCCCCCAGPSAVDRGTSCGRHFGWWHLTQTFSTAHAMSAKQRVRTHPGNPAKNPHSNMPMPKPARHFTRASVGTLWHATLTIHPTADAHSSHTLKAATMLSRGSSIAELPCQVSSCSPSPHPSTPSALPSSHTARQLPISLTGCTTHYQNNRVSVVVHSRACRRARQTRACLNTSSMEAVPV